MDLQLKNKVALVTGSTAGIGFAIAKQLLQEGATVHINGRTKERVEEAIKKLTPFGKVHGVAADFSKPGEISQLLLRVPSVDILINNVGIYEMKGFTDITDKDWITYFEINVLSGIRLSRQYFPAMLTSNWGRIIFVSSESAITIPGDMMHYAMTKTAQLALSRGLAELSKGTNVTINAVLPGPTKSESVSNIIDYMSGANNITTTQFEASFIETRKPTSLIKRFLSTEEVANLVTYVASPLSSATNGASLRVDGGVINTIA